MAAAGEFSVDPDPPPSTRDVRQVVALAVLSLLVAGLAVAAWRWIPPAIAPRINIRWAPGVTEADRTAAEQRFKLLRGELRDGRTWAYDLGDVSRANVRAMVADRAVEDTHYINRSAATVWRTAPRGTMAVGGAINRARDSAALTWAATGSATTAFVAVLWLAMIGRRIRSL